MQLTRFTDLGLRVLMYLCHAEPPQAITIAEVTERFDVARNPLTTIDWATWCAPWSEAVI